MPRRICLLIFTDGRGDCLRRTLASAVENLPLDGFAERIIVNDSADPAYRKKITEVIPTNFKVIHHHNRRGFAGAIRSGWEHVGDVDFIFHLEDDFLFNRPVELDSMVEVLDGHPDLLQLALLRQPWNEEEHAAGGIIEKDPGDYTQASDAAGHWWVEHRRFFTTNPSLYRESLIRGHAWPQVEHSEGIFTHKLLEDPNVRFAFWGRIGDPPRVHHIGADRVGTGY